MELSSRKLWENMAVSRPLFFSSSPQCGSRSPSFRSSWLMMMQFKKAVEEYKEGHP